MQQAEAALSGAAESGFPSREAAAQAGAELAQRLGLAPDQALDKLSPQSCSRVGEVREVSL